MADDLDDLGELGMKNFKPAKKGAIFLFDMGHYYILLHDKNRLSKIKDILVPENKNEKK